MRTSIHMFCALAAVPALAQDATVMLDPDLFSPTQPDSPYMYPSPNATGLGWDIAFAKARRFVAQLTLEEKVQLCTGWGFPSEAGDGGYKSCQGAIAPIERVNFTGICYSDSDTGIGNSHFFGTGFPPGITASSTWNRELMRARGFAIATEIRAKGVHAVLGPVLAFSRTVGGGTNFEGFGNDPYLIGVAGCETVIGHQAAGVQAEPKQFLGYDGQQWNRSYYSSNIGDQTVHEVNAWPYAEAVRAGAACVMTAYPYVNNTQTNQNAHLLNDILKTNLGFQGYTQTDWFGLKTGVLAALAGLDQEMPGVEKKYGTWSFFGANYTAAVKNGSVPESRLTDAAIRIMTPYFWLGQDVNYPSVNLVDDPRKAITNSQRQRHRSVAHEVAAAGTVLLKNTAGKKGLPLAKPTTIALFGRAAGQNPYGPNQYAYIDPNLMPADYESLTLAEIYGMGTTVVGTAEGTLAGGGGSGSTYYPRLVDPISAIQQRASEDMTLVDWSTGSNLTFAAAIAQRGTVCLPVVSSYAGEGVDRDLKLLHNGDVLINTVADNCDNTIPIVQSVGQVDMEAWIEHPNVTAVLWANLGGQELGPALVDILYGRINPSGRLVYTIARNISDYAQPDITTEPRPYPQINYTEGVSIDYRGFERFNKTPRYWFGHGLSYSNFTYSALTVRKHAALDAALQTPVAYVADAPGGDSRLFDPAIVVEFKIYNEGPYDGSEVPQLYLQMPAEAGNPTKVLRGFDNVQVRDGETQTVNLYLRRKDISYWSVVQQTWVVPNGTFVITIGASSNDPRLVGGFEV